MKTFQIHATVTHRDTGQTFELVPFLFEAIDEVIALQYANRIVNPFAEYDCHIVATERVGEK